MTKRLDEAARKHGYADWAQASAALPDQEDPFHSIIRDAEQSIRDRWLAAKAELKRLEALDDDIDQHPDVAPIFEAFRATEVGSTEEKLAEAAYDAAAARAGTEITQLIDLQKVLCESLKDDLLASDEEIEFTLRDPESGVTKQIRAETEKLALEEAREWARGGDYGEIESTIWVDVYVSQETDRGYDPNRGSDEETCVTVAIDPDEPACAEGRKHDWRAPYSVLGGLEDNPGVRGHGGGVICKTVCAHCGAYKIEDSWAQRPDNGEQGLESVRYEEADDDSLEWVAEEAKRR